MQNQRRECIRCFHVRRAIYSPFTLWDIRFDLTLDKRLEYLTLAVGNAKSHPVAVGGRHEDAISFLTELEEELEVAQVQLELYHTLAPRMDEAGEVAEKIKFLTTRLFTVTEVNQRVLFFKFFLWLEIGG